MNIPPTSTLSDADRAELLAVEAKINALLPPRYVGCFEDVSPKSMGSAALKYDQQGKVKWGEIWTTFCHLALAGGPPHRGRWLKPVTRSEALSRPDEQRLVVAEIERAIRLSSELSTTEETMPGWVGIRCHDQDMAAWLVRAIVAENVSARHDAEILYVPAGPDFRIEKEIKNVVVSVAKTCHYLLDHVEPSERPRGFAGDLIQPPLPDELAASLLDYQSAAHEIANQIQVQTGLTTTVAETPDWVGIQCASEEMAIWLLRTIVVEDILARREGEVLFVPVCFSGSLGARDKLQAVACRAHRLWSLHSASAKDN